MISKEVKYVLTGEYCNPMLDRSMYSLLRTSLVSLDLTSYMKLRELRTNAIMQDELIEEYAHNKEGGLSL